MLFAGLYDSATLDGESFSSEHNKSHHNNARGFEPAAAAAAARAWGGGGEGFLCVSRTEWVLTVAGGGFDYRPVRTALDVHDRDDGGEQQLRVAARPTTRHPQLARVSRPLARHVDAVVGSKTKPSFRPVQRLGLSTRMVSRPPVPHSPPTYIHPSIHTAPTLSYAISIPRSRNVFTF